jgi:hypothetical protein
MGEATTLLEQVETLGFPIVVAVLGAGAIYLMMRWMMGVLMGKLQATHDITVCLIDRIRQLDNSVLRLETMVRLLHDLPPDWERLGKLDPEDRRKD